MTKKYTLATKIVLREHAGQELSKFAREILGVSSRQLQRIIRTKGLLLNGRVAHSKRKVRTGDLVELLLPQKEQVKIPIASPGSLPILYEDPWLIAVEKPTGLPSYSLANGRGLANQVAGYFTSQNLQLTPRPLHRLDTPTSGLVLFAKDAQTQTQMGKLWQAGKVKRFYWALCEGILEEAVEITLPINGQKAHTKVKPVRQHANYTEIRAQLITGRTHQIRRHLQELGHPIVGDQRYGTSKHKENTRLALHAHGVCFPHPRKGGQELEIISHIPYGEFPFIDQQPC